jgi:VWFA-related protein
MRAGARIAQIGLLVVSLLTVSLAQTPPPNRKKLKDFGSSLKRLKWNPQTNTAVEAAPAAGEVEEFDEGDVIRIDTSLVTSELLVVDSRGNTISGLTADDFIITENGESQKVGHFFKGDNVDVPRTIVLIIDYSGSQMPYIKNSVAAAKVLVDKLGPKDLMAIVTDDVELLIDFTKDKNELKTKLDSLIERARPSKGFSSKELRLGRSMQYSALMATLKEAFTSEDVRPIVIFQTDGDEAFFLRNPIIDVTLPPDMEGKELKKAQEQLQRRQKEIREKVREFSLEDVYLAAEKSRATVYTVVPGYRHIGLTLDEQVARVRAGQERRNDELMAGMSPKSQEFFKKWRDQYAKNMSLAYEKYVAQHWFKLQTGLAVIGGLTGGWTDFLEMPEQADAIYARIFSDINQRYIVGYYPTNKTRDGNRRKIDFEVKGHPEYQIYGRRSYFAPKP